MNDSTRTPTERERTAYHEAGHAVTLCVFGLGEAINYVASTSTKGGEAGRIQLRFPNDVPSVRDWPQDKNGSNEELRVIIRLLYSFAGPAAEGRFESGFGRTYDWYKDWPGIYEEEFFTEDVFASRIVEKRGQVSEAKVRRLDNLSDFESAFYAAVIFWGDRDRDRIDDLLDFMASKASEFVDHAMIWSEISRLAGKLMQKTSCLGVDFAKECELRLREFDLNEFLESIKQQLPTR